MNTLKSFRYLSVAVLLGTWGCSQKQVATKGDYDDLYGSSKDAPQVTYKTSTQPSNIYQNPDYTDNLRYQREETPVQTEGTDEYFDENYVNSRKIQRGYSAEPGYSAGFSEGYQSGWNDYAWSQPVGWASPFNRFGYNSPFGFNSWNSWGGFNGLSIGFGMGYGMGYGMGGWGNRFYDPFWGGGFGNPYYSMYSPWGMGGWGNPYSFYNSFYSPYDYYGGYGFGYPRYIYNVTSGVDGLARTRTYGPRDGGRASGVYNDRFNNSAVRNVDNARRGDANARSYSGSGTGRSYSNSDGYYATPRRNGSSDNSSFNGTPNSRTNSGSSSSSDAYYARPRRNGGYEGGNSSSARTYDYSRPSSSSSRSSGISTGSGNTRSSSRGSDSWSRSPSSNTNSTWSAPSRSSSSSSSGSVGGSRGGGSSGGGGGSRGPR